MFSYPINKYKFYTAGNKVIAVSTYEGRYVRGVAKCDPRDGFDVEKGKALAAARCNAKIAAKRTKRANKELTKALDACAKAQDRVNRMNDYFNDARIAERDARMDVDGILRTM
jgi:crotonobetainyl-CoA:carnitine CoA-transferase CaiB-like acyl-CoA transferase